LNDEIIVMPEFKCIDFSLATSIMHHELNLEIPGPLHALQGTYYSGQAHVSLGGLNISIDLYVYPYMYALHKL
jgi:hypothetical protein